MSTSDEFPAALIDRPEIQLQSEAASGAWVSVREALHRAETDPAEAEVASELVRLSGPVELRIPAFADHIAALRKQTSPSYASVLAILDAVECRPTFDRRFAEHLSRTLGATEGTDTEDRARWLQRLRRHERICDALAEAAAEVGTPPTTRAAGLTAADVDARTEHAKRRVIAAQAIYERGASTD